MLLSLLAATALAEKAHPVRQEVVDQVRLRTASWQPKEVHENHLRNYAVDKLPLGNLGSDDSNSALEVGIKAISFTKEKFDEIRSDLFGSLHHTSHKLTDYSDWDILPDDDVYADEDEQPAATEEGETDSGEH